MMKALSRWAYVLASRALKGTPLRRLNRLSRLHNRMFEMLSASDTLHLNGFVLHLDPRDRVIAKKLALYGEYEDFVRELLLSLAVPGTIVVDVGANIGLHTLGLSRRVGADGRVIAFEPDPDNHRILLRNIDSNSLKNVCAHKLALSSGTGTAPLYQSLENRGGLSLSQENTVNTGSYMAPVLVETVVADEFLADLDRPISLVKVDVEGAEPMVLQGMRETLMRNPSVKIVFEFWPRYIRNFQVDPLTFLTQLEEQRFSFSIVDSDARRLIPTDASKLVALGERSSTAMNVLAQRSDE